MNSGPCQRAAKEFNVKGRTGDDHLMPEEKCGLEGNMFHLKLPHDIFIPRKCCKSMEYDSV